MLPAHLTAPGAAVSGSLVARGRRGKFKVIDSSHSASEGRCAFHLPKREVHAAITMDDQPTLIQLQHA